MGAPSLDPIAPRGASPATPRVRAVRWLPSLFQPTFEELVPRTRTNRTRRDWVLDAMAVLVTIAVGLLAHESAKATGDAFTGAREVIDLALLPVGAAALLWRRRWPLQVAIFLGLLTLLAPSPGFAVIVAAFSVGAYLPPTTALAGLGFLVVTAPLSAWLARDYGADSTWWSDALFSTFATIGIGAWGMFTGTRRQLLATLQERARRAEAEQELRVAQAKQDERTRIAREMHDVLAHRMSLLSVHAGALEFRPDAPPEDVARAAGVIRQTAHEALEELRTVIGVLRASEVTGGEATTGAPDGTSPPAQPEPPQPTLAEVSALVAEWQAAGARIDLDATVDPATVPVATGRTAYRLVQEGLTNASKHAPAARITIAISGQPGERLTVQVSNPLPAGGAAEPTIPGTGLGLVGLRERTELAGGSFSAGADPAARRFMLSATLPWPA